MSCSAKPGSFAVAATSRRAGLNGWPQFPQPVKGFLPNRVRKQMRIRIGMLQVTVNHGVYPNIMPAVCHGNYLGGTTAASSRRTRATEPILDLLAHSRPSVEFGGAGRNQTMTVGGRPNFG